MSAPMPRQADERVLSTLNRDGTRRWLNPRLAPGRFWQRRRIVGYGLIVLFTLIPYLRMNGKPLILLDVPRREFTLFGTTFLPTDTMFLMLLLVGIFISIFLLTALFGRVWCGWACPQTVYMELVYRPIERLIEGRRRSRDGVSAGRRVVKLAVYLLLSMFLAHTFLAYFVGVERLLVWVRSSPFAHPAAFVIMAVTTLLMLLDFGWFREQVCLVACPYGRFQSVLLDRHSLIVGYDRRRGEPRRKIRKNAPAGEAGDCIDCGACVQVCPTGIDIRDGLQMECVHCTQCIDACDDVMDRVGRPRGLVRYTSQEAVETGRRRFLRPRVVFYPALLAIVFGMLGLALAGREPADVTVLRGIGSPFTVLPTGEISNQIRIKLVNRSETGHDYAIDLADAGRLRLVAPQNPVPVPPGAAETATLFVLAPRDAFDDGVLAVRFRIADGAGFSKEVSYTLLGPQDEAGEGD